MKINLIIKIVILNQDKEIGFRFRHYDKIKCYRYRKMLSISLLIEEMGQLSNISMT